MPTFSFTLKYWFSFTIQAAAKAKAEERAAERAAKEKVGVFARNEKRSARILLKKLNLFSSP